MGNFIQVSGFSLGSGPGSTSKIGWVCRFNRVFLAIPGGSITNYNTLAMFVGKLCKHVKTGHVQTMAGSVNLFDDDVDVSDDHNSETEYSM